MENIIAKNLLLGLTCEKCQFYHRTWPANIEWENCAFYIKQINNTCEKFKTYIENNLDERKTSYE